MECDENGFIGRQCMFKEDNTPPCEPLPMYNTDDEVKSKCISKKTKVECSRVTGQTERQALESLLEKYNTDNSEALTDLQNDLRKINMAEEHLNDEYTIIEEKQEAILE